MRIAIVTSEAAPFSKTGGLADVTGSLFREYRKMGHEAYLFVPLYRKTAELFRDEIRDTGLGLDIPLGKATRQCRVFSGGDVFFIGNDDYFGRDELYGTALGDYPDNDQRFVFFCKSVLEIWRGLDLKMDAVHCNDWQTGLIPLYLKTIYRDDPVCKKARSVLTIHNLGYQGIFPAQTMEITGLDRSLFTPEGVEFYGKVNLLKAGIISADTVNTVSGTYAKEILTPGFGFGLDGVLRERADSLTGILNGVDYNEWDPAGDGFLPAKYSKKDLSGKGVCKKELLKKCGLKGEPSAPLLCFIGRLSDQKGIDILADSVPGLISEGMNVAVLGRGDSHYQEMMGSLRERFTGNFFFHSGFDEALAHLCYAGSDIFMMPSRYEPCGLGQLIAMRYGSISVARRTGGLVDTIEDGKTGFLFDEYSTGAFTLGMRRALEAFADKKLWQGIMKKAMGRDFSWKKPAGTYIEVFSGRKNERKPRK